MISVCLTTFNGELYIRQQLDSILCQLNMDDEVIVSDDGSTDSTLDIVNTINDQRVKVLRHTSNLEWNGHKKATFNFENALKNAKGDFIFLSDQDDVWNPQKITSCIEALQEYEFVVHNMRIIDKNNNILKETRYEINPLPRTWISIVYHMNLWGCCMAFRRDCLKFLLPFPSNLLAHDYWIAALCIKKVKCTYLDKPLINYRVHLDSVSYKKPHSLFYKIKYRIDLLKEIIKRK